MEEKVLENFEFETFIDIHSNVFMDYVGVALKGKTRWAASNLREDVI